MIRSRCRGRGPARDPGRAEDGAFHNTRERIAPSRREASDVLGDLRGLLRNGPLAGAGRLGLLCTVAQSARASVIVHYFEYHVGSQTLSLPAFVPGLGGTRRWSMEALVSAFNASGALASLCGVVLMTALVRAVGRKRAFMGLYGAVLASTLAVYWLRPDQVFSLLGLGVNSLSVAPLPESRCNSATDTGFVNLEE